MPTDTPDPLCVKAARAIHEIIKQRIESAGLGYSYDEDCVINDALTIQQVIPVGEMRTVCKILYHVTQADGTLDAVDDDRQSGAKQCRLVKEMTISEMRIINAFIAAQEVK